MNKYLFCIFSLSFFLYVSMAQAGYASQLPAFSLQDVAGKTYTQKNFEKGVIIIVTAPTLSNKGAQEGWSDQLTATKSGNKRGLILLEDMTAALFKKTALNRMKKEYKPGVEPVLLIDDTGEVRKKMGVEEGKTIVLVYDDNGKLIHTEVGKPSKSLAQALWKKLK